MQPPRPSSNIPEARRRLSVIADALDQDAGTTNYAASIRAIVQILMTRKFSNLPVAPYRKGAGLTPLVAARIRAVKAAYPSLSQAEIASMVGCGAGRVSEALAGHERSPEKHDTRIRTRAPKGSPTT